MSIHRDHRAPDGSGSWLAWGSVVLVVAWAAWWALPHTAVEPTSMGTQVVLPMLVQVVAAAALGWGLLRRRVPAVPGQLALLVLGAALTMQGLVLLLLLVPAG